MRSDGIISDRSAALSKAIDEEAERRSALGERRLGASWINSSLASHAEAEGLLAEAGIRHLQGEQHKQQWYTGWTVDILYEAVDGNIFEAKVLDDIRAFENRLESLPSYRDFCLLSRIDIGNCRGLRSIMRFLHGSRELVIANPFMTAYELTPTGLEHQRNDVGAIIEAMREEKIWRAGGEPAGRLWYFDNKFPNSRLVRSKASFGKPLRGFSLYTEAHKKQEEALLSLLLVYLYMAAYTRAPMIALFGMMTMILSIPIGMVLFRLSGHPTMPAINFLVLFLLTGIGADNLFILIDTWRQTKRDFRNLKSRLRLTFARAGKSLTACGTTTAVSFIANVFSSVRPLRWFGTFVGLCVFANLFLCLAMFPPMLLLRERTKRRKIANDDAEGTSSTVIVIQSAAPVDSNIHTSPAARKRRSPNSPNSGGAASPASSPRSPIQRDVPDSSHWLDERALQIAARKESNHAADPKLSVQRSCCYCCHLRRRPADVTLDVSSFADLGDGKKQAQNPKRLKRGEHYFSELYAPEDEAGRHVPFNWAEHFFGDVLAPMLKRGYIPVLVVGLAITLVNFVLVRQYMKPSNAYPALFARGAHNLGDIRFKRAEFGDAEFDSRMETEPLQICERCKWDQDCEWGSWSDWVPCNRNFTWCQGRNVRSRRVKVPRGPTGQNCTGNYAEFKDCNGPCALFPAGGTGTIGTSVLSVGTTGVSQDTYSASTSSAPLVAANTDSSYASAPAQGLTRLPPGINPKLSDKHVASVHLVFGVKKVYFKDGGSDLDSVEYVSDSELNIEDPIVQIGMSRLCRIIEEQGNLLAVRRQDCVIEEFKAYLAKNSIDFPVTPGNRIHELLDWFISHRLDHLERWKAHVGFTGGRIRFIQLEIRTNLPKTMSAADAWAWALRWDDYINMINTKKNPPFALPHCFHTSPLWVRADAERQLVDSTLLCALASVLFATGVVFWFLADVLLGLLLMVTVVCIIVALAALMFTVYGWEFGAIEAISLIIVIGFSVDYALHVAEFYNQSSESTRYLRVQDALRRTGGALLGAAATTLLACPPILFCSIHMFVQFGMTLIANMILALIFSVLFFAALLVAAGPKPSNGGSGSCDLCRCLACFTQSATWVDETAPLSPVSNSSTRGALEHPSGTLEDPSDEELASHHHVNKPTVVQAPVARSPSVVQAPGARLSMWPEVPNCNPARGLPDKPTVVHAPGARVSMRPDQAPYLIGHSAWEQADAPDPDLC
eukprot:TRINITY_DN3768_c1_g1_i2.p1 TRINITY_DN3768_c1_g1~~TRINITY_DN3768_c1_g1_i2.p1  ORF type:complete len:1305 (+),score=119.87 TRINITY_DN3768_c1_g1_i2:214-3915(+)